MIFPPDLTFEQNFWNANIIHVAGIDEVGRGALAGPVVAAVVIFPPDPSLKIILNGVRDSKQLTPRARARWTPLIKETAEAWGIDLASAEEIDRLGIIVSTKLAVMRAVDNLSIKPDHLITDYLILPECDIPQSALVKGDQKSMSVSAASILAKTYRDALMVEMDSVYPRYGFAQHKGYGTRQHKSALQLMGACPIHRKSFGMNFTDSTSLPGKKPKGLRPVPGKASG